MLESFESDSSLDDFFTDLYNQISTSEIQNSFIDYKYSNISPTSKLYKNIELYKNQGTNFYSKFMTNNPNINIKRIGRIRFGEIIYDDLESDFLETKSRRLVVTHTGKYYLTFTVYFDKK